MVTRMPTSAMRIGSRVVLGCALFAPGLDGPRALAQSQSDYPFEVVVREQWRSHGDPGFSRPAGMVQWPDGTVWVGDNRLAEVVEITPDGSQADVVLREGEGPGEVGRVHRMDAVPGDGVVIEAGSHVHRFGPDKRFRRRFSRNWRVWTWGFAAVPDGGIVVSGGLGSDQSQDNTGYAVHRFDGSARHVASWHPAVDHQDWEVVRSTAGGPVAVTADGGLLVSDAAPFRITRYSDLAGSGAKVVIEDETVLSRAELDKAVVRRGDRIAYTEGWNKSVYVGELDDGRILNVAFFWPAERGARQRSLWIVVSPEGEMLARTWVDTGYHVWNKTPDGRYLASFLDYETFQPAVAKLEVAITPR